MCSQCDLSVCSQCGLYKETAQFSPWLQPRAFDIPSTVERLTSELPLALSLEGNYKRPRWRDWQSEGLLYRKPSHMTVWEGLLARLQQSLLGSWGKNLWLRLLFVWGRMSWSIRSSYPQVKGGMTDQVRTLEPQSGAGICIWTQPDPQGHSVYSLWID